MPAPTCVWVDSQTEPFEGRGKTKRTSDSVDDIESNPERPEILDESCRRRQELSSPLTNLSTIVRKHSSTSCSLWSLPRFFLVHGLYQEDIQHMTGVKDANLLAWYNRHYLGERLRVPRAIGL